MQTQEPPPEGPRRSPPIIFKNGSMTLFFLSSIARLSLSFDGTGTSAEMRKLAKMLANALSTACRRRAMGFVVMAVDVLALLGLLWASDEVLEVEPVRERD